MAGHARAGALAGIGTTKRAGAAFATVLALSFTPGLASPASAADFTPAPGAYTADTNTLTITGPGTNIAGTNQGGVAVFSFDTVNIQNGVTIKGVGARPLKIVASGNLTLAGLIDGRGTSATDGTPATGFGNPGGPGGGVGGIGANTAGPAPGGPGAGGSAAIPEDGGGGGGFGGQGAHAGSGLTGGPGGTGGVAYGDLNGALQGGSGGGGTQSYAGGGGGGAIALFGATVTISATGAVRVDGGGGAAGGAGGATGGGSGGGILIRGDTVDVSGVLSATGGDGGLNGAPPGPCCGDGGGGGGGRIAYQYRTLTVGGTATVAGGTSGVRTTSGGGAGPTSGHGDPLGAAGVVTMRPAPSAVTTAATAVSTTGATLTGTVNPRGTQTTYHFEFGPTNAYGTAVPAADVAVGADSAEHSGADSLTGLAPGTTYHYRVVATDALGFITAGSDVAFTTASPNPTSTDPTGTDPTTTDPTGQDPTGPGDPVPDTTSPETTIGNGPKKVETKRASAKVKFTFTSSEPGSSFECRLDTKPFTPCTSPAKLKAKLGKHRFEVRATDLAGNVEWSPASLRFKVVEG